MSDRWAINSRQFLKQSRIVISICWPSLKAGTGTLEMFPSDALPRLASVTSTSPGTKDEEAAWWSTFMNISKRSESTSTSRWPRSNTLLSRWQQLSFVLKVLFYNLLGVAIKSDAWQSLLSPSTDQDQLSPTPTSSVNSCPSWKSWLHSILSWSLWVTSTFTWRIRWMVTASRRNNSWESFSLVQHVDAPTHSAGRILDVVITRSDCQINNLIVDPPTISDHGLITCTVPYACPVSSVFTSWRVRGWKKLDREEFRAVLSDGPLCQDEEYYAGMSASELFDLYNTTIRDTLDRLAPLHDITSRHNPSTPWFDAKCWSIKRAVRLLLERRYHCTKDPADRLAWINALQEKHSAFKSKENSLLGEYGKVEFIQS